MSANNEPYVAPKAPEVPSSGNGPACDDSKFWEPSTNPHEGEIPGVPIKKSSNEKY